MSAPVEFKPTWVQQAAGPTCPRCGAPLQPTSDAEGAAEGVHPEGGCGSCSQAGGCALLVCPNCGYDVPNPRRSPLAYHLSRLVSRWGAKREPNP